MFPLNFDGNDGYYIKSHVPIIYEAQMPQCYVCS